MSSLTNRLENASKPATVFENWFQGHYGVLPADYHGPGEPLPVAEPGDREPDRPVTRPVQRKAEKIAQREANPRPKRKTKKERAKSHRQRKAEKQAAEARDYRQRQDKLIDSLQDIGIFIKWTHVIPRAVWAMDADIIADRTGEVGEYYLARCRNKVGAALLREAAFAGWRSWTSLRARRIIALGLAEMALSESTRNRGRYRRITRGIPIKAICALLADPHEPNRELAVPGETAINGTHRPNGNYIDGQVGYTIALSQVGFHYRQQLPANEVRDFERIGDWAINRYWIVTANPLDSQNEAEQKRLYELAAAELARIEGMDLYNRPDVKSPAAAIGRPPGNSPPDESRAPP